MRYFLMKATTFYDGYEWRHWEVFWAGNLEAAWRKARSLDFTHNNGIEAQCIDSVEEIKTGEFVVLAHYLK